VPGFTSPAILFLTTWDAPERAFCHQVCRALPQRGYTRYIEPCSGAFAMPLVARNAGWAPSQMEMSDVSLFSAILGQLFSGQPLADLGVELDGEEVELVGRGPVDQAAHLLWVQLLTRTEARPEGDYWISLIEDLKQNRQHHIDSITSRLSGMAEKLGGSNFAALDMWAHMEQVLDDPHAFVCINPPSYKCLGWGERILMADLTWQDVARVRVGDQIIGVDEHGSAQGYRRYRQGVVTESVARTAERVKVLLADGTEVICTPEHPWLTQTVPGARRRWTEAWQLDGLRVFRGFEPWETDESRDGGWLAGMYDGEGSLNQRQGPKASTQLGLSQKPGELLDRAERLLKERGFETGIYDTGGASSLVIHNTADVARALGSLRPGRLLAKYEVDRPARAIAAVEVIGVEPIGRGLIQSISTDIHTYIGEGFWHHNSGFENFFNTHGRLTWAEPTYDVFDPDTDLAQLSAMFEGRKALLLLQHQREPGKAVHPTPVFARDLSLGQFVYLVSNRPDEIFSITGGPKVARRNTNEIIPGDMPIIPPDYEIKPTSRLEALQVKGVVADYYRGLWMHRLVADLKEGNNVLMLVDGMAAGIIGYSTDSMIRPFTSDSRWASHMILRFAFGAPSQRYRLTRLATMMALQKRTAEMTATPQTSIFFQASLGLVTVEYTRHPEAKGLRGLMTFVERDKHPDGFKLVYGADWLCQDYTQVLTEFLTKEARWRAQRQKSEAVVGTDAIPDRPADGVLAIERKPKPRRVRKDPDLQQDAPAPSADV
jgi:hypothetical protein